MSNVFLLAWDMLGLETCVNITQVNGKDVWNALKNGKSKSKLSEIYSLTLMRARLNSHRHYEIYTVVMDTSIDERQIRNMFALNPQSMADLIRERGECVYSARAGTGEIVIR